MQKLNIAAVAVAMLALSTPSQATPLTGDTVTIDINNGEIVQSTTVGAGTDTTIGATLWDFDAGVDSDIFQISVNGSFNTFAGGGPLSIELSDLDFLGGEILVGFVDLFSVYAGTTLSIFDHSIVFNMTDGPSGPGVVLSGSFVTRPAGVAVPEPASLALFGAGLAGLGAVGWRRRKSRQ